MPVPTHQPPAPGETIVFFGDSVTDCRHREDEDRLGQGHVRLLAEGALQDRRVINAGISGNRVVDLQQRLADDVLTQRPDVVSIMIGINDTWRRFDRDDATSTADYEAGLRDIITRVIESGARLVLVEPFVLPVTDEQATAWREDLDPRIAVVHRIAGEIGVVVVPTDRELNRLAAEQGAEVLAADGVHPTPTGHQAIAALWAATVLAA